MSNSQQENISHNLISHNLKARRRAELRFKAYGIAALGFAFSMLLLLVTILLVPSINGIQRSEIRLEIIQNDNLSPPKASLLALFPEVSSRMEKRQLFGLISNGAEEQMQKAIDKKENFVWVTASDIADLYIKNPQSENNSLSAEQVNWLKALQAKNALRKNIDWGFFTNGDSRSPQDAGFAGAIIGSLWMLLVCISVAFPIGVGAAVYLEEFSKKSRLRDFIEVNINNLAAVPSIVFGLLGLAVFLNFASLPRSSTLVGGLTLAMMILPVIIIATRAALRAVPSSIRQAALALGASPLKVVLHHSIPLALPGIMTGTILGMARAMGETAPLLMIGMVAFVVDIPHNILQPATAMPVQIYIWASSPEAGFAGKTSTGIVVLIFMLFILNAAAIYLRKKSERQW